MSFYRVLHQLMYKLVSSMVSLDIEVVLNKSKNTLLYSFLYFISIQLALFLILSYISCEFLSLLLKLVKMDFSLFKSFFFGFLVELYSSRKESSSETPKSLVGLNLLKLMFQYAILLIEFKSVSISSISTFFLRGSFLGTRTDSYSSIFCLLILFSQSSRFNCGELFLSLSFLSSNFYLRLSNLFRSLSGCFIFYYCFVYF